MIIDADDKSDRVNCLNALQSIDRGVNYRVTNTIAYYDYMNPTVQRCEHMNDAKNNCQTLVHHLYVTIVLIYSVGTTNHTYSHYCSIKDEFVFYKEFVTFRLIGKFQTEHSPNEYISMSISLVVHMHRHT